MNNSGSSKKLAKMRTALVACTLARMVSYFEKYMTLQNETMKPKTTKRKLRNSSTSI